MGIGPLYAILAYGAWGLLPIYWKFLDAVPAVEVLSHRIIWSMVFLSGILLLQRRWAELTELLRSPRRLVLLAFTALLLSFNWGLYIYGVNSDQVVEASLGYFINPLVNVLLGFLFFRERLLRSQLLAVGLAIVAVVNFIWQLGTVPWIALGLAFSFAFYGMLRKIALVTPMIGLAVETLMVTPLAIALVSYWAVQGVGSFSGHWPITLLLVGAGITTSLPLLWFNHAAKRLRFSTLGFFQYIAPSLQLMVGVFLYREPFTATHVVTFGLIWVALLAYSIPALWRRPVL